jgi:hypothetical protein
MSATAETILDRWLLDALARSGTRTPTELAAQLAIPREMVIEGLIGLAERGLIADASEDQSSAEVDADDGGMSA